MEPTKPQKKLHLKTYGCQMNVYDSERMQALLTEKGYRLEGTMAEADVILLNTCSIRDKSEQKVRTLLGQLKPLKVRKPELVIGVAGCIGQRLGRSLLQKAPHLDLVLGPDSVDRVVDLVEEALKNGKRISETKFDAPGRSYSQTALVRGKPAEFLTIMKGCDHFCTYCIVPFTRGREKSRSIAEIMGDVERMRDLGTKEVTFLGQNINTYGKGTGENLSQLIEQTSKISGLERIRYLTSHPRDLGNDLIDQFGTVENLCPNLHLPFQSGSDRILKAMFRVYTKDEYLRKVDLLRKARPDIALTTDVIVGFPGETEEDFEETLEVMRRVRFSGAFLFKYSPRPGTRASSLAQNEVPEKVKEERHARLFELSNSIIEADNQSLLGTTIPVLIETLDKKGLTYTGRSPHGKLVHVLNAGEACIGKIISVEVTEAMGSNLKGYYDQAPRLQRRTNQSISASL